MTIEISAEARKRLAVFLPVAIAQALESYQRFMDTPAEPEEPADEDANKPKPRIPKPRASKAKHFKDHHDACKMAIAHIELLLKLAEAVHQDNEDAAKDEAFQQMMSTAREELDNKRGTYE
jgi:hypothetical protein